MLKAQKLQSQRIGRSAIFLLGPHAPELQAADIELIHSLWPEFTERYGFGPEFHHRDVIRIALRRLEKELQSRRADEVVEDIRREVVSQDLPRPVA